MFVERKCLNKRESQDEAASLGDGDDGLRASVALVWSPCEMEPLAGPRLFGGSFVDAFVAMGRARCSVSLWCSVVRVRVLLSLLTDGV